MSPSQSHPVPVAVDSKIAELEREALAKRGTDNQRARYAAGFLPEDELLAIARAELFAPFNAFKPWHNRFLKPHAVKHRERTCRGTIAFETADADELTHDQWEVLAQIKAAAEIAADHHWIVRSCVHGGADVHKVRVDPLAHWATCEVCGAEEVRASVKVTIQWAGRLLTREYAL